MNLGLSFLEKLRPVDYLRKNDIEKRREWWFIAQEIESTLNTLSYTGAWIIRADSTPERFLTFRPTDLFAPIVRAIQELSQNLKHQNQDIQLLKNENKELRLMVEELSKQITEIRNQK
jgi:phage shock protein A